MSEKLWQEIDAAALDAFRMCGRLEAIADKVFPEGGRRRVEKRLSAEKDDPGLLEVLKGAAFTIEAMRVQMHSWEIEPAVNSKLIEARIRAVIARAEGQPS